MCGDGNELDDGIGLFLGPQVVVAAHESGDVDRCSRPDLEPVSGFRVDEILGLRRRVAQHRDDQRQPAGARNRREVHANPSLVERRRPQGAGRGRPEALAGKRLPHHARGWLHARARVGVVLHLGAERDRQAVPEERDLVLDEGGHERRGLFGGGQRKADVSRELVAAEPVAGAGDQILMRTESRVVLRVDVEGALVVRSHRLLAARDVDERLDLQRRAAGARVRPAAKEMAALRIGGVVRERFASGGLRVEVRPERARLGRR